MTHRTFLARRALWHALLGVLALLPLGGCEQDDPAPVTQVLVTVTADPEVLQQLHRIEARIYRTEAVYDPQPLDTHVFSLPATMPLSFGIVQRDAERFLLLLEGHGPADAGEKALIERKVRAEYVDARSMQLDVHLATACLRLPSPCRDLALTCRADVPACGPVEAAEMREMEEVGKVLPPEVPARPPLPEACRTSTCPPAYPCAPTPGGGHVCLGRFADWPMPDAMPGSAHPPRYDLDTPGLVRDAVTGLVWQREPPSTYPGCVSRAYDDGAIGSGCTWDEAKLYCHDLALGGLSWRLPSKVELESIVNPLEKPAISSTTFPGCDFITWTSSPTASSQTHEVRQAWLGFADGGALVPARVTWGACVRCVSGVPTSAGTPDARYVLEADQTVRDAYTGLRWQRTASPPIDSLEQATAYCSAAGGGFRLPTQKELLTLVDPARAMPAIDPVFLNTPPVAMWGAPAPGAPAGSALGVAFGQGVQVSLSPRREQNTVTDLLAPFDDSSPRVRCVR